MFVNVDWFFYSHRLPIAKAAKKNKIKMSVYTDFTDNQEKKEEDEYCIYQSPIRRTSKSILHVILEFLNVFILIKNRKPDLIHAVTIKPILLLGLASRFTSTPFIAAISGLGPAFQPKSWSDKMRLNIIVKLLRVIFRNRKAKIICQSKDDRDVLVGQGITIVKNVSLVSGSGVDISIYSPLKKRSNSKKYILMSSRILRDKGIEEYCLAAKIVREKYGKEIEFKLSGPIDDQSPTFISEVELEKLTLSCGVEYIGNRKDMPELLASALIFVFPSYYAEGMPKVLLEAASCGTPVITTNHSGCRDTIIEGETGILVPLQDVNALADAIIGLLKNKKLCTKMSSKARALAESSYCDSEVVNTHYKLYRQLCNLVI